MDWHNEWYDAAQRRAMYIGQAAMDCPLCRQEREKGDAVGERQRGHSRFAGQLRRVAGAGDLAAIVKLSTAKPRPNPDQGRAAGEGADVRGFANPGHPVGCSWSGLTCLSMICCKLLSSRVRIKQNVNATAPASPATVPLPDGANRGARPAPRARSLRPLRQNRRRPASVTRQAGSPNQPSTRMFTRILAVCRPAVSTTHAESRPIVPARDRQ